ncbi:CsgG/HfaB family protein [Actibacterium sp. MT2.3-13A]|uniref:CsgG/HfaB family protein n=1 Tax=Actibacterium sp. MT2.3-13A TaxID=2828332 RepID=UPI001BAC9799|nr:CsgG/HfaB family protein [Actibacterium sp. MT2.3-13A]
MPKLHFRSAPGAAALILSAALLGACAAPGDLPELQGAPPSFATKTAIGVELERLPAPRRPVDVAVYGYSDQTGQQKPADNFSRFSKAVTQGGTAVLIDVLKDVGGAGWFNVVERAGLQNLLTERNLIDQTNLAYRGTSRSVLPPLRFAGIILEGGIIDYDTNSMTGGFGARILGVGASTSYRRDRLTVSLRAVSVNTGEVLTSVMTEKTVYSVLVRGDVFRYVSADEILEIEAGLSRNEPVGLAVRQAIELAVYSLVIEGAMNGLWSFQNAAEQSRHIALYRQRKAGAVAASATAAAAPAKTAPAPQTQTAKAPAEGAEGA